MKPLALAPMFASVIQRDLTLALRRRSDALTTFFFFVIVVSSCPASHAGTRLEPAMCCDRLRERYEAGD